VLNCPRRLLYQLFLVRAAPRPLYRCRFQLANSRSGLREPVWRQRSNTQMHWRRAYAVGARLGITR
jgi:hypothetical protein